MSSDEHAESPNSVENREEKAPSRDLNATVQLLQQSIQGIQQSFGVLFSSMASNLKQSMEITGTMNSVMEQFLKSSVRISTKISGSRLVLSITNQCQIPVPTPKCQLETWVRGSEEKVEIPIVPLSSKLVKLGSSVQPIDAPSFTTENFALPAMAQHVETIELKPPRLDQYNAKCTLSFPSPGTGQTLTITHEFGIYLIDQLQTCISETEPSLPEVGTIKLQIAFLREICRIPPAMGVSSDLRVDLSTPGESNGVVVAQIHILSIEDDGLIAQCKVSGVETAGVLLKELERLSPSN
ncbi:uncharacterized protein VTP21DRAFT_4183 [Calcarisporiella thermophila]|uniref:uncharacterized protein n=1 Tax=Calcarisporiella thermophila TaxID=911321 RepID=UPI003742449C